jgi:hypothetical protein
MCPLFLRATIPPRHEHDAATGILERPARARQGASVFAGQLTARLLVWMERRVQSRPCSMGTGALRGGKGLDNEIK